MDKEIPSEDLMARIAKGDADAFETLVNRHQTSILNLIYRFIGDRTQAKDQGFKGSVYTGLAISQNV